MADREQARVDFLNRCGLGAARRQALAGDASTRAYERLSPATGPSLILMDQPPSVETQPCPPNATDDERRALGYNSMARLAAGQIRAFVAVAEWLVAHGLAAPVIHHADPEQGFAVLEDLGDDLIARCAERGDDVTPMYEAAIDALIHLHRQPVPEIFEGKAGRWPMLKYDDLALQTGAGLFLEWWPKFTGICAFTPQAQAEWDNLWAPVRAMGNAGACVLAHRDYHAENLVWRPEQSGHARIGMLDFQDALIAHPAWDLLSLLQDARRDVAPETEAAMLDRYLAARPDLDQARFVQDYRALAALNAARILFIFARQVAGFGRPHYRQFVPRTWNHLMRNLQDPSLAGLMAWFQRNVPEYHA